MPTFAELSAKDRYELYDTWLKAIAPNRPKYYRSHIKEDNKNIKEYCKGLPQGGIYGCAVPADLLHVSAAILQNENFIQIDHKSNYQYSNALKTYLKWVYHYISENDSSLVQDFKKALREHEYIYSRLIDELNNNTLEISDDADDDKLENETESGESEGYPWNRILYGAPGTGKSHRLKLQTDEIPPEQIERVTFHPEYTYFDFVGSYKPIMVEKDGDEVIAYHFEAGPFAKTLKKALLHSDEKYYLVIEEINRARAVAVFGDLFQLLDRDSQGRSEYGITPSRDFAKYLTENNEDGDGVQLESGKLYLPDNFFIWATMNSADQGVFPLDTAFKRRWSFEYIPIDQNENKIKEYEYGEDWNTLRKHVNTLLQNAGINEDKQLGAFFLKEEELSDEEHYEKAIKEKVIMYLYEDAARHQRRDIFKDENVRFSDICQKFDGTIESIFIGIDEQ